MAGSANSEDGDIGFQIAPMVDVVFVLMLFFMACAGSQEHLGELKIDLPSRSISNPAEHPPVPIMIDISPEGEVRMNDAVYGQATDKGLERLQDWLKTYGGEDPVFIRPQPDTRHERIVEVLNAVHHAGVKNLTFS